MYSAKKIDLKSLIVSIVIPLVIGGLSSLFTVKNMGIYKDIQLPPLSPPSIVFPIVWSILYILMGISCYKIYNLKVDNSIALRVYILQLFFNFCWSLLFFNARWFLTSFIWLIALWILIITMIYEFHKLDKLSAYLQIPYLVWVTFAGYLNFAIHMLNK